MKALYPSGEGRSLSLEPGTWEREEATSASLSWRPLLRPCDLPAVGIEFTEQLKKKSEAVCAQEGVHVEIRDLQNGKPGKNTNSKNINIASWLPHAVPQLVSNAFKG